MKGIPTPPAWAERSLAAFLASRDVESVSGDLLEEYRERVYPDRGPRRADLWYVTQVLGFAWRSAGIWAALFASAFLIRTAIDWRMATSDFQTRSAVSTILGLGIFLAAGFWSGSRSRSSVSGAIVGVATSALAVPMQLLGVGLLLAVWHDPTTMAAIRGSGGLEEVITMPLLAVVPGVLVGMFGGVLGAATTQRRSA